MYADDVALEEQIEFREDQRINLGKWILRYLFANLIDEEIRRDEAFRKQLLNDKPSGMQRANAPGSIQLPPSDLHAWQDNTGPTSASTLRPANGIHAPLQTPGLNIGLATPGPALHYITSHASTAHNALTPTAEEGSQLEKMASQQTHSRASSDQRDRVSDYFSAAPAPSGQPATTPGGTINNLKTPSTETGPEDVAPDTDTPKSKESRMFGKKFTMNFSMSKLTKTKTNTSETATSKPSAMIAEEKSEDSDSRSSRTDDRIIEDNFFGSVQRIRMGYEELLERGLGGEGQQLQSAITPSLPNDTPVLKPPPQTTILIQEDRADSGGVADLFEGTVGNMGEKGMADAIERHAPMWLGDVLLRNQLPIKDIVKVSFVLEPWRDVLPSIASDGNNRLNANRMLRARKIMAYVAERIETAEQMEQGGLRAEEYLELYCNDKLIPPTMTLATIRAHVWRGGGDVLMYYKSNGRRQIANTPAPQAAAGVEERQSGE
ncbi:hypothetical protein LTS18_007199, partial [Coniosporium uncinatum]